MEGYELKDAIPTDLTLHTKLQAKCVTGHAHIVYNADGTENNHVAYTHLEIETNINKSYYTR